MAEDWCSYFCNVNDVLASIFLNLELRKAAPDRNKPNLLWVWVYMKSPREDGLSSRSEFEMLRAIEDQLTKLMTHKFDAVFVGELLPTAAENSTTTRRVRSSWRLRLKTRSIGSAAMSSTAAGNRIRVGRSTSRSCIPRKRTANAYKIASCLMCWSKKVISCKDHETFGTGFTFAPRQIGKSSVPQ